MEKILIFTNYFSLGSVESFLSEQKNIPLVENDNIVFSEQTQEFKIAQSINDGSIFFIKDCITEQDLNSLLGGYDKGKIGVLKHRNPTFFFDGYKKCEPNGSHEANGRFYPDVLRIITTDDSNDKFSQLQIAIWSTDNAKHDKETAAIEFLQDSIYQGKIPDTLPNEISEYHAAYDKFRREVNALSEEEKRLTNIKYSCLIKLFKRDLGL